MISSGEEKAWEILEKIEPADVCRNASVTFDEKNKCYILKSFCIDFSVIPKEKIIRSPTSQGETIIKKYGYFFIHSCLWYLINAKDLPLTGRLVKPFDIKGGEMFFRGSHILPLESLAKKYGDDKKAFIRKGTELCSDVSNYGDASFNLLPMPRIPVTLILWLKDDEFPPRTDLLLDSSCELQLPIDIIWSIAMLSVLVMM
ncbi:MAG: hypothetical protein A2Y97_05990 [Nitrospirae bacterium RBG_13_39_12]|nr:MAG: hypothetical protein A2Y97_05990 [Nitrospirae bacterium RBG_13_39_12]